MEVTERTSSCWRSRKASLRGNRCGLNEKSAMKNWGKVCQAEGQNLPEDETDAQ